MGTCQYCHRHFNLDRLAKHESVCKRMMNSKRKVFDASKHRVRGTEAEKYLKRQQQPPQRPTQQAHAGHNNPSMRYSSAAAANNLQMEPNPAVRKSNWRKKHEEFIKAIREAKKVQAHLARGGKLSDLPPPPPSDNDDYVQCPHCLRRFNEAAAERHIPKCANMKHNKTTKPPLNTSRRR